MKEIKVVKSGGEMIVLILIFLLLLTSPVSAKGTHSQAIQLERGWNLVSWYVELPDETEWDWRRMDDVFREPPLQQGQPYGDYFKMEHQTGPGK